MHLVMALALVVRDGAAIVFCSCGLPVPREVIAVAVCRYLRYGVSDRDVEELSQSAALSWTT